jgi:phospholipid:diacylglycerol acyltransferase
MITYRAADNGASGIVISPIPSSSASDDIRDDTAIFRNKNATAKRVRILDDYNLNKNTNNNNNNNNNDNDNDNCEKKYQPESTKRKIIRRTLFAIGVLIVQTVLSATLKRYGLITKDLNEIVAEKLAPVAETATDLLQLQQTISFMELLELRWKDTIESAKYMVPNFNETLYWLRLNQTANQHQGSMPTTQDRLRPGYQLATQYNATGQYPVVMIPGFVTSGLEVWKGKACMQNWFRERIWGGFASAQYWLRERYCVMENMALDPVNGGDPDGIKLRSAHGFEAADFFVGNDWMWGNYWVFSKIFENLADVGYDGGTMTMEAYDWRLAMSMLEKRDGYFTHLKSRIEAYHKTTGKKVVLASHSMGAIVVHYFFAWVTEKESKGGGGGGKYWVDKHVHAYVNIAGSQLGVIKASSALMSGEMSDTVFMGGLGNVVEHFIPRKARKDLWSSWGSLWGMLPKGGDGIWSVGAEFPRKKIDSDHATEETPVTPAKYADAFDKYLFVMSDSEDDESSNLYPMCNRDDLIDKESESIVNEALQNFASKEGHSVEDAIKFLLKWGGGLGTGTASAKFHSFNYDHREKSSSRTWHDLTQTPLPFAPNMKIYCMYGVNIDTERAYVYKKNTYSGGFMDDNSSDDGRTRIVDPPFILDTSAEDPENGVIHGIKYTDGDGSVPLMSLGYMCAGPWRDKKSGLNPSRSKVIIREYEHRPAFTVDDPMRKGPYSSEHVDILGNIEM